MCRIIWRQKSVYKTVDDSWNELAEFIISQPTFPILYLQYITRVFRITMRNGRSSLFICWSLLTSMIKADLNGPERSHTRKPCSILICFVDFLIYTAKFRDSVSFSVANYFDCVHIYFRSTRIQEQRMKKILSVYFNLEIRKGRKVSDRITFVRTTSP